MSPPRRLDNMRNTGNLIVNQKDDTYDSRAGRRAKEYEKAKKYARKQSPDLDEIQSWANKMQQVNQGQPQRQRQQAPISEFDLDVDVDVPKMHLVPCRWERSGWKYVQVDPKEHTFFNNPNRVNSFGIGTTQKRRGN